MLSIIINPLCLGDMVSAFFNVLNISYTIGGFTFTLLDVFEAGIILSIFGFFIGKIIFGVFNRR